MDFKPIKFAIALCVVFVVCAACSTDGSNRAVPAITSDSSPAQKIIEQQVSSSQPARLVDFANFTLPWPSDLGDSKRVVSLHSGQLEPTRDEKGMIVEMGASLESIAYLEVTGDGAKEAIVVLSMITGGSAIPHAVYIYGLPEGNPKLLWSFSTGDRADGGLRQVYAENGELVIELYGKEKIVGGDLFAEDGMTGGDCCPTHFTLARYQWQKKRFQLKGKVEILSNPAGGAPVVMPPYDSSR